MLTSYDIPKRNIFQKIYNKYFIQYAWAHRIRSLLYPYYLCYQILGARRSSDLQNISLTRIRKSYRKVKKIVWYIDNLKNYKHLATDNIKVISHCILIGKSRFIIQDENVSLDVNSSSINIHDLYKEYFLQEELLQLAKYDCKNVIRINTGHVSASMQNKWISLLHPCSENWMHFISECMPKLQTIQESSVIENYGVIIDEDLPRTAKELLTIFIPQNSIVAIPYGSEISVDQLLIPVQSKATCSGFWSRNRTFKPGFFEFDAHSLLNIRKRILNYFAIEPKKLNKVYVARKSRFRNVTNASELQTTLLEKGFEIIEPGSLSLHEQVQIFSQTSILVAQAGAALANMIFMPPGAKVICLRANNNWVTCSKYFSEFAKVFELDFSYFTCPIPKEYVYSEEALYSEKHPMNASFQVPINQLLKEIFN